MIVYVLRPIRTLRSWLRWCLVWCAGLSACCVLAQPIGVLVLQDAPPAVRELLQQAVEIESGSQADDADWQTAVLYCRAAGWGSAEAYYRLGMLYAFGRGVPESRQDAAALFATASALGHAAAQKMLESIELKSNELPPCVSSGQVPIKAVAPQPIFNGITLSKESSAGIDRYLQRLPTDRQWIVALTSSLSRWYALDPKLVLSVIAVESNFQTNAQSPKEASGLMQLIPDTAARFNIRNAFDATQNLRGGMRYLRWLLSYYQGQLPYVLAAYNAGEGRVDRYKGVPPFAETRAYVKRIVALYGQVHHSFEEGLAVSPTWLSPQRP